MFNVIEYKTTAVLSIGDRDEIKLRAGLTDRISEVDKSSS
jgi:hypothetical protein